MLKPLRLLQKIEGNKLDILRQNKNVFLEKKDALLEERQKLQDALQQEKLLAEKSEELNYSFSNFLAFVRYQQDEIDKKVSYLDEQIFKLEEQIAEGFAEQKKYEILADKIMIENLKKAERIEQNMMDEINSIRHTRELRNYQE